MGFRPKNKSFARDRIGIINNRADTVSVWYPTVAFCPRLILRKWVRIYSFHTHMGNREE
jgi:hypothetical protein